MKKLKLLFQILFILPVTLFAQNVMITGVVNSDDGEALPGVTVVVQGTTQGTITDFDGKYSISVPTDGTLLFSYIGYKSQSVPVAGKSKIDVVLGTDYVGLEEVVAIGYGVTKKSDLTGAVSSLKTDELNMGVSANVDQMLQGRAAGVQVYQSSSEPGGGISVNIRGVGTINAGTQPLYVIDGLPIDNDPVISGSGTGFTATRNQRNPLNSLNPSDIESIEVLKDASATAIYGSRGANGVILITTKRGQQGKVQVHYDAYYGTQSVFKKLDVMTASEYRTVLNELTADGASNSDSQVGAFEGDGTDWQDEIFRVAPVQEHNVSVSGGNGKTTYYSSLGYFKQDGVVISSDIERYTARFNFETNVGNKFRYGMNLSASLILDDFVPNGVVPNENAGVIGTAFDFDPTLPVIDPETGVYSVSQYIQKDNPLAVAYGMDSKQKTFRTQGYAFGEYAIIPDLKLKVNIGGDFSNAKKDVFIDSRTIQGRDNGGVASILTGFRYNYLLESILNYNKTIKEIHVLNAMVGVSYQDFVFERFNGNASGFVVEATKTNDMGAGSQTTFGLNSVKVPNRLASYIGRINYAFDNRFLLTASLRADGSSRFGPNNKFGYFPSGALGWKLHEESFLQNHPVITTLKLRASYGETGNQEIPNFLYVTSMEAANNPAIIGDNQYVGYLPSSMPNEDLKWENTSQMDFGLDFGLLDGRLSGTIDYFYRKTTDMLQQVPVPPQTGFSNRWENIGDMENRGLEFSLNTRNFIGDFNWTTNLNFSAIQNEVLDLYKYDEIVSGAGGVQFLDSPTIIRPGEPIHSYYGYEVDGVWQQGEDPETVFPGAGLVAGDWKYKDQLTIDSDGDGIFDKADGVLNAKDRVVLGDPIPDFTWGMINDFSYKGISLTIGLQGVHGVQLLNNQLAEAFFPINFRRNKLAEPYLNRWTPENPTNDYASFVNVGRQGVNKITSKTVLDASYVRIQNISLGYDVPVKKINAVESLKVYMTVNNLYTFTNYIGMDPGASVNGAGTARVDYNAYPLARTIMFGVNVVF